MTAIESDIEELDWAVSTEITVNWGDMDSLGHVNHSVFAKWMETTRMKLFSEIGMMDLYESSNIGPILARIEVDYKAQYFSPTLSSVRHWFLELVGAPSI